jgi:hypothetical protein
MLGNFRSNAAGHRTTRFTQSAPQQAPAGRFAWAVNPIRPTVPDDQSVSMERSVPPQKAESKEKSRVWGIISSKSFGKTAPDPVILALIKPSALIQRYSSAIRRFLVCPLLFKSRKIRTVRNAQIVDA